MTNMTANFSNTHLGPGDVSFPNIKLNTSTLDFSSSKFGRGNRDFSKTKASANSRITFEGCEFATGDISFSNSTFTHSALNFSIRHAAGNKVLFDKMNFHSDSNNQPLPTLYLNDANISADHLSFASTQFTNGIFKADGFKFEGKNFDLKHLTFVIAENLNGSDGGLFDMSGANINCDRFSFTGANVNLKTLSWDEIVINADQIAFNQTKIHGEFLDFSNSKLKAKQIDFHDCIWQGTRSTLRGQNLILLI